MTMTQDERISRLEGAFEVLSVVAANMVTKDELRSAIDGQKEEPRRKCRDSAAKCDQK